MPLPAFLLIGAAVVPAVAAAVSEAADSITDRKVNQRIDRGAAKLEAGLKILTKKCNAWRTKGIVILGTLLFFMILYPTWLALVFFIFIAILMFMKNPRKYLRLFMKYLRLHKFNLHSAIDIFIDHLVRDKVRTEVNEALNGLSSLESALTAKSGFSLPRIESAIFRRSNYSVLKKELRNSILSLFSRRVFLIPLVLYLIALAWSEYGFW